MANDAKPAEPTSKEAFFMLHVLNNQEGNPKINWDAVAEANGLKNGNVASVRFGQIKRRLGWTAPSKGSSGASAPSKVTKRAPTGTGGRGRAGRPKARPAKAEEATPPSSSPIKSDPDSEDRDEGGEDSDHNAAVIKPEQHDSIDTSHAVVDEDANFFASLDSIEREDAEKYGGALGKMKAEMEQCVAEAEEDDYGSAIEV